MRRRELSALLAGAVVAMPLAARAQQKAMPIIGFLSSRSPGESDALVSSFRRGLSETGYVEGQNVAIEYRWADGHYDRLPALASDLIGRDADVIVAGGAPATRAAKSATSAIPIVFNTGTDPVADGLVTSLARPGGNLTGVTGLTVEMLPKLFELLSELIPQARVIAALVNPNNPNTEHDVGGIQEAARAKGMQLRILRAGGENEIAAAFATLDQVHAGALLIVGDPLFLILRKQLVALAAHQAVPAMYMAREFAVEGGLISYGSSIPSIYHQLGIYAGKILRGAKPNDLPVQRPATFELIINLKTAKALGLVVPQLLLAQVDEVIE
jgi:putative ABC transport system substrate-binding protein